MNLVIFKTQEASFQFSKKAVMELMENRKSSYEIKELDDLIKAISSQPENATLSFEEHRFIAMDLINAGEGSVVCKNCGEQYRSNQFEVFTVGPDDATFKAATEKKNLFRKRPRPPGIFGGKGYKCPRGHILIYMQTWTS